MKRTAFVFMATAALLLAACHDEPVSPDDTIPDTIPNAISDTIVRDVIYKFCGQEQQITVTGGDNWHVLLDSFFTLLTDCGECDRLNLWSPETVGVREIDYDCLSTSDRQQAFNWCDDKFNQHYAVAVIYGCSTGKFNCLASKYDTPPASDYTAIPLAEYLPGTWVIDGNVRAVIIHNSYPWEVENPPFMYDFEYGYQYPYHDSVVFEGSDVFFSAYDTTCTYNILDSVTIRIYYYSCNSQIHQIGHDSMLFTVYQPRHVFTYEDNCDDWRNFTYLFHRQ